MADKDKIKSGDANLSTPAKAVHFSSTLSKITAAWTLADIKTTGNPNLARAAPNIAAAASAAAFDALRASAAALSARAAASFASNAAEETPPGLPRFIHAVKPSLIP